MNDLSQEACAAWYAALQARHLDSLSIQEVRRALQALSSLYVEHREKLSRGAALDGAGKRAAFALFYGPLHFLMVRRITDELKTATGALSRIVDLGCGTGAAGAAWAMEATGSPSILGIDRHPWAVQEARWTYRQLGLSGRAMRGDVVRSRLPGSGAALLAAFTVNELKEEAREAMRRRLLASAARGARVLVVEPIARRAFPWWDSWAEAFLKQGGRADTWRFSEELPEHLRRLDKAAGLDHSVLTARSVFL